MVVDAPKFPERVVRPDVTGAGVEAAQNKRDICSCSQGVPRSVSVVGTARQRNEAGGEGVPVGRETVQSAVQRGARADR
jgi:hypothetical protein